MSTGKQSRIRTRDACRPLAPAAFLLAVAAFLLLTYPVQEAGAQSMPTFTLSVVGSHTGVSKGGSLIVTVAGRNLSSDQICIEQPSVYAPGHTARIDFPENCFDSDNATRTFTVFINNGEEGSFDGGELWVSLNNRPPCGGQDYLVASPASVHLTVYDNEPTDERLTRADR